MMNAVQAHAKLTLSLRITGVRADGYHFIDAEMVSLDLADTLSFSEGDGLTVDGVAVDAGASNLIVRALRLVGRTAAVHLVKRIPVGGGLGGGSSDAAAVLRWAGRADDIVAAASLGADVPFCLAGGRARVRGVGEELEPLPCVPGEAYTLLTPPFPVSTAAAYRMWDSLGSPATGVNDLEPAAVAIEPRLLDWKDRLGSATGETPVLAGSGSTWWVPGAFPSVPGGVVARTLCPA
jgi:4-diphosphocytidyl-2-C-methyl-D-erythritol kinase